MSIHGVELTAQRVGGSPITESEVDRIFASLSSNMAIHTVDIASDLGMGTLSFMLSVECPNGLDAESLVPGIVDDALERALEGQSGAEIQQHALTFTPAFC